MNEENNKEVFQCICGKQFDNKKSLGSHKTTCKVYQELIKEEKIKQLQEKESRRLPNGMFKCECCGKEHDGSYGSGRFCCNHCRCSFNSKKQRLYPTKEQLQLRGFGKKPKNNGWKCQSCQKIFIIRADLRKHCKETGHLSEEVNGKGHGWSKGLTIQTSKSIAKASKTRKNNLQTGKTIHNWCGRKHSEETKQKQRIGMCNWLNSLPVDKKRANYNPNSIIMLEKIAKEHNWNIQHAENGGEFYTGIGYFVDAYDKEKNIVLEYDEPAHYDDVENNVLCEKDLKRQQEIIDHLHCEFWRYNEKMQCLWKVQ